MLKNILLSLVASTIIVTQANAKEVIIDHDVSTLYHTKNIIF